jgi:type II secretory pathway pseudopilin PulG
VEVIVALAAILLVVALLLPGTGGSRTSSRKSQCQDNLHNLAVALHSDETQHKAFPPGWVEQKPFAANWG